MKLKGKVAIVTGGGKGIGRAISVAFAREGASVSLAARSEKEMEEVAEMISSLGSRALLNKTDLTVFNQVERMVKHTVKEFGGIDILVNNSGIAGPTKYIYDITLEEWDYTFAVNLTGAFLCCKYVVPEMIERGGGKIINIASMTGKRPLPMRTPYCATKMGMIGFSRSLASELGRFNINVNSICPGAVQGSRIDQVIRDRAKAEGVSEDEVRKQLITLSPMNRMVTAEDIAEAAVFLASDEANNITGEDINVTAGAVMY